MILQLLLCLDRLISHQKQPVGPNGRKGLTVNANVSSSPRLTGYSLFLPSPVWVLWNLQVKYGWMYSNKNQLGKSLAKRLDILSIASIQHKGKSIYYIRGNLSPWPARAQASDVFGAWSAHRKSLAHRAPAAPHAYLKLDPRSNWRWSGSKKPWGVKIQGNMKW